MATQLIPVKQEKPLTCSAPNHDKPLKIFCQTCNEVICRDCTEHIHRDHEFDLVSACFPKHCQQLQLGLQHVKEKSDAIKNILTVLTERENGIKEKRDEIKEEIHVMVEKLMTDLRQSERQLTRQVEAVADGKLKVLSEQKKSAEMNLSRLIDCEDYVEQSLKIGSPQQVLMSMKQMMERMSQVTQQINEEEFNPMEKADVQLIKDDKAIEALHHIGDIVSYSSTELQQCKVKEIAQVEHLPKEKMFSFPLSIELPDSSLLTVPLSSLKCSLVPVGKGPPITATVSGTTRPGVYKVCCSTSGSYHVHVQVHDVQLEATSLVIPFNPYLDSVTPVRTVGELNHPREVAVSNDGNVIVTDFWGHCVTVLDREGKKLESFGGRGGSGNVKFTYPRGVAITPDNFILVTDNHRIQKISMNGQCVASVGEYGSGPLQFNYPRGITLSHITGKIYIADHANHRIQVLTPDLTFCHSFGEKGSADGQFINPQNIAIDSQGLLYVTDYGNHRIQKFTPDGKFLTQFGTKGSGPGQLTNPEGIAIDSTGLVYVAEGEGHRISIFTSDGQFVRSFGRTEINEYQFNSPHGITFDREGVLYICDYLNNRLVVY